MDRDARPGRARAEQLGRAIKHILLAWAGANSCCAVHASRGAGSRRAPNSAGRAASAGGTPRSAGAAKLKARTSRSSSLSGRVRKRCSLPNSRIPKISTYSSYFPRSLCNIQRTDLQGLRENAAAGPGGARSGGNTVGGRAEGDAVATPPASNPATSTSPSASGPAPLLLLSQALLNQPRTQGSRTKCSDGPVGAVSRLAIRYYQVKKC